MCHSEVYTNNVLLQLQAPVRMLRSVCFGSACGLGRGRVPYEGGSIRSTDTSSWPPTCGSLPTAPTAETLYGERHTHAYISLYMHGHGRSELLSVSVSMETVGKAPRLTITVEALSWRLQPVLCSLFAPSYMKQAHICSTHGTGCKLTSTAS